MSLITRCPTCETMFKVVPDQLRVSEGWVRCGQCAAIFDATQHMLPSPEADLPEATVSAPAPLSTLATPATPSPPAPAIAAPSPAALAQPAPTRASAWTTPVEAQAQPASEHPETDPQTIFLDQESELDAPASVTPSASQATPADSPRAAASTPAPASVSAPASSASSLPATTPTWSGLRTAASVHAVQPGDESAPEVSFLRSQDKPSVWKRPAVRWTLVLLVVVLLALLALQVVRKERDRIAAVAPATRGALLAMCRLSNCALSPLRQIESLVIDSSSFSREQGNDYRLGFSLRNTSVIDIALPAIELALTDAQDQPVIRKVIAPAQYAPGAPALERASIWTGSLALSVAPGANTERIAGYRLLAFYP